MFECLFDVVLQNMLVLNCINKDAFDESLPLLAFQRDIINAIFLKYSKEGRLFLSPVRIQNTVSYHIFVRVAQNITRCNLNIGVFRTPSNGLQLLTDYAKTLLFRCLKEHAPTEK